MKKLWYPLAALTLCLALCGCVKEQGQATEPSQSQPPAPTGSITDRPVQLPTRPTEPGEPVEFGATGAEKITYSVNISSIRYVTSADQLPDSESLKQYDDAYFETGALLLVMDTVNGGSVQVGISDITARDGEAWVTLSRTAEGDVTIPVMTTWMLWAEVEQGLEYRWTVRNPAMDSAVEDK